MLGTGNALVTKCYNTCFVLQEESGCFLVDGGGGNEILRRLEAANISLDDIHDIFVTHQHIDHLLGILWVLRILCARMKQGSYPGELRLYAHAELAEHIRELVEMLLQKSDAALFGTRIRLIPLSDGSTYEILGHSVCFFDIASTKVRQFGFALQLTENEKLACCGDEPYNERYARYVHGCKWLLHEAFCLAGDADRFHPYEKHHSTVRDACTTAQALHAENLLLYHTEDSDLPHRKARYIAEGKAFFFGRLLVPDDMESIEL